MFTYNCMAEGGIGDGNVGGEFRKGPGIVSRSDRESRK